VNRLRKHNRLALLPAVVWLLAQLTMAYAPSLHGHHAVAEDTSSSYTTVICSSSGNRTVQIPLANTDTPEAPPHNHLFDCKWCHLFSSCGAAAPLKHHRYVNKGIETRQNWSDDPLPVGITTGIGFLGRAPPFS